VLGTGFPDQMVDDEPEEQGYDGGAPLRRGLGSTIPSEGHVGPDLIRAFASSSGATPEE
jgi:hypothetical protein